MYQSKLGQYSRRWLPTVSWKVIDAIVGKTSENSREVGLRVLKVHELGLEVPKVHESRWLKFNVTPSIN